MKLNHLDVQVPDVQACAAFFTTHFDFTQVSNPHSPAIAILTGEGPFTLVLQHHPKPEYPEGFHLGFLVDDVHTVHEHRARLVAANLSPSAVQVNGRGTMFYLRAPGGVLVEVSHRGR